MANVLQIKHRKTGASGGPTGASLVGEIALNFAVTGTPELWASNGSGYLRVNPPGVSPNVKGIISGAAGATVEASFNADHPKVDPGDIVIYTWKGSAYIYSGPTGAAVSVATSAHFTSLGSAVSFATAAEIAGGTEATKAINSAILRGETLNSPSTGTAGAVDVNKLVRLDAAGLVDAGFLPPSTAFASDAETDTGIATDRALNPANLLHMLTTVFGFTTANVKKATAASDTTPANDAGKLVLLNAAGQIASSFLPATPSEVKGAADVTIAMVAPVPAYKSGDIVFANKAGTVHTSWAGAAGTAIKSGDALIFDGTNWHAIPNETDLSAYLPLAGGTISGPTGKITFDAGTAGHDIIDGNQGKLVNVVIDCGTY